MYNPLVAGLQHSFLQNVDLFGGFWDFRARVRYIEKWNGPKQLEDKRTRSLMMLPTDYVIIQDKSFKKFARAYADNQELFFKDFSAAVSKLFELGVPEAQWVTPEPWILKTSEEQAAEEKK